MRYKKRFRINFLLLIGWVKVTRSKEKGVEPTVSRIEGVEVVDTWRNHLIAFNNGEKLDV